MARAAIPPLLSSPSIIRATIVLVPSYLLHPHCRQPPHRHPHRHRARRVVLYNFPLSVPLRVALTIHEARQSSRRILLAIFHAAGILIDIVLVASYLLSSTPPASSPPSSLTSYSPRLTRYCPCGWHPHWYPLHCCRSHCVVSHPANCLWYCHTER